MSSYLCFPNQTELKQHKSDMAACKQERQQLQVSVSEHSQHLQEEREKKQQLTAQLELQQTELLTLKSEFLQLCCIFLMTVKMTEWINTFIVVVRNHSVIFINMKIYQRLMNSASE